MSLERRATRRSTAENRLSLEPDLVVEKKGPLEEVKAAVEVKKGGLKDENEENILGAEGGEVPEGGNGTLVGEEDAQDGLKEEAVQDESDCGEPEAKLIKLDVDEEEATNDSGVSGESATSTTKPKRKEKVTFPCPECDWKFQKKGLLTKHMKQHSEIKPFQCEQCEKGFFQAKGLLKHVKTIHQGEDVSLHLCPFCQKGFITRSEMDNHSETHVHEYKIYACRFCGKTFNKKFAMKVAIQASQDVTPDPCPYCNKGINAKAYADK